MCKTLLPEWFAHFYQVLSIMYSRCINITGIYLLYLFSGTDITQGEQHIVFYFVTIKKGIKTL